MKNFGIESSKVIASVEGVDVRSCKGVAEVVEYYDSGVGRSCYGNGGAKQTVFGFYIDGIGYWFKKKSDALFGAEWVAQNDYHGEGDLEAYLQGEICTKENDWKDLGKVYF